MLIPLFIDVVSVLSVFFGAECFLGIGSSVLCVCVCVCVFVCLLTSIAHTLSLLLMLFSLSFTFISLLLFLYFLYLSPLSYLTHLIFNISDSPLSKLGN